MTPEEVRKLCDEHTIGVVPTLGVTFTMKAAIEYSQQHLVHTPMTVRQAMCT